MNEWVHKQRRSFFSSPDDVEKHADQTFMYKTCLRKDICIQLDNVYRKELGMNFRELGMNFNNNILGLKENLLI